MTDASGSEHRHLLLIGGQRCGTTWLQNVLASHRHIVNSTVIRPEPKFFLDEGSHAEYDRLFPEHESADWLLDKSTTYLERADAAERASVVVPDATVIVVLRDPVLRAHSNWKLSRKHGIETLSFARAMQPTEQSRTWSGISTSPFEYVRRGCYAQLLDPWLEAFDERLVVLQYERMVASDGIAYLIDRLAPLRAVLDEPWTELPAPINSIEDEATATDPELRACAALFEESNRSLEVLGIDLELWAH